MNRHRILSILCILTLLLFGVRGAEADIRFPQPEFESGHLLPASFTPAARSRALEYADVAVLAICLALASYLALRKRSRTLLFFLMVFALLYFGFWKKGCVCPVGATQNLALALFDPQYRIPITVIAFFTLPLAVALVFGRTFCAAVCPLGALQDVFLLKPVRVPSWLAQVLGMIPYAYLGFIILGVATGSGFYICRVDPFVSFFRRSGSINRLLYSAAFLLAGVFIGRPYCRFLCPYGVLLRWMSRFSRHHVTITPDECVQCRLCENACPFGCIHTPQAETEPLPVRREKRRLITLLVLVPVLVAAGGIIGSRLDVPLSRINRTVLLAEQLAGEQSGKIFDLTLEAEAFRASGKPRGELLAEALSLRSGFRRGGFILGSFLGLVLGLRLIELSIRRKRDRFEIDRAGCFSCGRCFAACPREQRIRKERKGRIIVHEP